MIAGALLVAALEVGFQAHRAAAKALPPPARRAARPLGGALRLARGAAWAAALTLGAVGLRRACALAAERLAAAAESGGDAEVGAEVGTDTGAHVPAS